MRLEHIMRHVTMYRDPQRFAAWPATYGMWSWGQEIVCGFTLGWPSKHSGFHSRDRRRAFEQRQARSVDGGETWQVLPMPCRTPGNRALADDEHMRPNMRVQYAIDRGMANSPEPCPGGINFTHPDFALMCVRTGLGAGTTSFFYISDDRCRNWQGPYNLPMFGMAGIEARSDYLVDGPTECTLFLTAARDSGPEGRGVFCARTTDGGTSFRFVAWVCEIPEGEGWAIMPASVRLPGGRILTSVRRRGEEIRGPLARNWIDLYASDDNGATWRYLTRPVADTGYGGNPPTLTRLLDGRLCMTYAYRSAPHDMRACISADSGETWGDDIILRSGAGNHDIGYPRAILRPDGNMVTTYYWNDRADGERYMAATLWRP
jgi:hypothetical protein